MTGTCPAACAMPKSVTLTTPSALIRMFPGLTSRWMTPALCAAASPVRGLRGHVEGHGGIDRVDHEDVGEGRAVDVLHHQVRGTVGPGGPVVVHLRDVRVVERPGVLRFLAEPLKRLRVVRVLWAQHFHRYRAFKQQVSCPPHLADASRCDPLVQPVTVIQYQARSRHNAARLPWRIMRNPGTRETYANLGKRPGMPRGPRCHLMYFCTSAPRAGRAAFTCLTALPRTVLYAFTIVARLDARWRLSVIASRASATSSSRLAR